MSEEAAAGATAAPAPSDGGALALALASASREEADAFLRDQRRLVGLQAKELAHELDLRHWSLWVRHLSDVLKLTFEVGLALAALGLVCFIAAAVWNAAHAEGLVIEPFSVPPDLASRGVTGQVVASQMLDQLTIMQTSTQSARPGRSYANSWGDDLKVEIPETGVSIGEAYRFLRRWLGHETHVGGELVRTTTGIAITARIDGNSGTTFRGPESDLDALIVKSAERIYRIAQPDRYARYIFIPRPGLTVPRYDEARAILNQMAREAPPAEKYWAWVGLGVMNRFRGDYRGAAEAYRHAAAITPGRSVGPAISESRIGHSEYALAAVRIVQRQLERGTIGEIDSNFVAIIQNGTRLQLALLLGDFRAAADQARTAAARDDALTTRESPHAQVIHILALLHDGGGVRAYGAGMPPPASLSIAAQRALARVLAEGTLGHYRAMIAMAPDAEKTALAAAADNYVARDTLELQLRPLLALARAKTGDPAGARGLIATSPLDCYYCLRIRGRIAEEASLPQEADAWFARAIHDAPSIPFAYADWGNALLARGQPDTAITKFRQANEKGPHFADPLEGWGEALMAKNQSHRALAKFAEAEKYAPNWGRLHLKWGEALVYAGKPQQAKAQFTRAATLDLTTSEKSELARMTHV